MGLDRGAEIGVLRGLNSAAMLKANPRLVLICVDPWATYDGYPDYRRQSRMDGFYADTKANLAPFGERVSIIRDYSVRAVDLVAQESLGFAYIDGNHYFDPAMLDLIPMVGAGEAGGNGGRA